MHTCTYTPTIHVIVKFENKVKEKTLKAFMKKQNQLYMKKQE